MHDEKDLLEKMKKMISYSVYEMLKRVELQDSLNGCLGEIPDELLPCPSDLDLIDSDDICMVRGEICRECWKHALEKME